MKTAKFLVAGLALLLAAGCASVQKVERGDRPVGDRLTITLEGPWNHVSAPGMGPAQTWTMEGLPLDRLLIYSGLKDEQAAHAVAPGGARKSFAFRSKMEPHEVVAMFEGMLTLDGSTFKLVRLEPSTFGGEKGFRFEYALVRKVDNVQLSGIGYGAVSKGELFALLYQAPRLAFFARHQPQIEKIARSARIKG